MLKMIRGHQRGMALVPVLVLMVLLMSMGAALHSGIIADLGLRNAHQVSTQGFAAAEAGVNYGIATYRNIFLTENIPTGSDFDPHSFSLGPRTVNYQLSAVPGWSSGKQIVVPAGRQFAGLWATEYKYTANSSSQLLTGNTEATLGSEFDVDYIPLFQYLAFYQGDLEILPGPVATLHGPIHSNGNIYFDSGNTLTIADCSPTMAAPNFCASGTYPTVHISTAGDVYRGRKDNPNTAGACAGTVKIAKLIDQTGTNPPLALQTMACSSGSSNQKETSAQLATWLGAITTHINKLTIPTPDDFVYGTGKGWTHAELRIVLDLRNADTNGYYAIVAQDVDGNVDPVQNPILQNFINAKQGAIFYNDVPNAGDETLASCATAGSYCKANSYAAPFLSNAEVYPCAWSDLGTPPNAGCVNGYIQNKSLGTGTALASGSKTARRGGFYNNREKAWVRMLNVNVHDLLKWNRAQDSDEQLFNPDENTDGGVVLYLTVQGPDSNGIPNTNPKTRYGVRTFGSSDLDFPAGMADPTGLTVVSDQAIYVEGTYNLGTGQHPKMPAAFMGDTINVLSAAWSGVNSTQNDYQSRQALAARNGISESIYAGFIGGVNLTSVGNYNGGLENYPRFHEGWGGTLTYRGSFVNLGLPRHNNGAWCGTGAGCNIYNPPARDWDFDLAFQTVANLPPLTPSSVGVEQILFTESFK